MRYTILRQAYLARAANGQSFTRKVPITTNPPTPVRPCFRESLETLKGSVRPSAHGDECCSKTFLTAAGLTFSSGLSAVLSMSSSATGIRSGVGMWGQPANPRQRERQRERTTPGPAPTQTTDKNGSSTGSSQPRSTAPESSAPAVSSAVPKLSLGEKARTRPLDSPRKYENK